MMQRKLDGKVIFQKNEDQEAKRLKNLRVTMNKKSEAYNKSLIPKIKNSLSQSDNSRAKAARSIGVKPTNYLDLG